MESILASAARRDAAHAAVAYPWLSDRGHASPQRKPGAMQEGIMSKHVIIASALPSQPHPVPLRYSLGYHDEGVWCEPLWTCDPWQARWVDAPEAAIETALLARLCPGDHLQSWS